MSHTLPVISNRPARARHAIMFCCDTGYMPFAVTAAEQIRRFNPDPAFDICICDTGPLSLPDSAKDMDLRTCAIDITGIFDGLRLDKGRTDVVYLRLAIPHAFAEEYDRILYMDADIWVQGGDFQALLSLDLGGKVFGAVRDNIQWRSPNKKPEQFKRLGYPAAPYFNAGVLLIDVAEYLRRDILAKCVKIGRENREKMIRHDQNLLNSVLQGDWTEISPVWNWQYTWSSRLFEPMVCPNVVHFIGPQKPWNARDGRFPRRFADGFRLSLDRQGWDRDVPERPGPLSDPPSMRRMLFKHLVGLNQTSRYVAQFPDDLTVIPHART